METSGFVTTLQTAFRVRRYLPTVVGALGILMIGWLIAVVARASNCGCSLR